MKYRALGRTGIEVSEIGLGGEWLERQDAAAVRAVVDRCDELGMNLLDCWMPNPEIRSMLGAALRGRRNRWFIQGHLGATWLNGQYDRTRDVVRVRAAFEDMLARFETDYIDLGMLHFVDEVKDYEVVLNGDVYRLALELKKQGTIRHIGLSTHNPRVARLAAESGDIGMVLFSLNPAFDMLPASEEIDRLFDVASYEDAGLGGIAPERDELYRVCEREGVGITVMKAYAGGRLLDSDASPFGVALTPVQCLHYALTRPAVASVLVGFETVAHVDAAAAYETATEAEKDYASVLANAPKHRYKGQCTYCGHCSPCPVGIDIAMVNKYDDLASMQEQVPPTVRAHYGALPNRAADCIECGDCEERCPFGVKVIERMRETTKRFG
jgi:predicted aldo/keto reductase-like oxidoreductase